MNDRSLYDVLGVDPSADDAALKSAFRKRSKETHPDHGGNAAEFAEVQAAYATLSDPQRRAAYDATLSGEEEMGVSAAEIGSVVRRLTRNPRLGKLAEGAATAFAGFKQVLFNLDPEDGSGKDEPKPGR